MIESFGSAVFDDNIRNAPREGREFVKSQYERFGVPIPNGCEFLYTYGLAVVHHFVNNYDPYALFWEYSDVKMTDDWMNFTYEIKDTKYTKKEEMFPESTETFVYVPGQSESFFEKHIAMPGVDAFPDAIKIGVKDVSHEVLTGDFTPDWLWSDDYPDTRIMALKIEEACTRNGVLNEGMFGAYFDLSLWAAVLWFFGPLSRDFRCTFSELTSTALVDGECVVYRGEVIAPQFYTKIARPPQSCYQCGVDAWCVESTIDDCGTPRLICEGCLSEGMPRYEGPTCGSKFCKYFNCHHNYWYQNGHGSMGAMRQHGQLAEKARNAAQARGAIAAQKDKKLING